MVLMNLIRLSVPFLGNGSMVGRWLDPWQTGKLGLGSIAGDNRFGLRDGLRRRR